MLKKLLVVLLALTLIATPALATCPTTWNDPNLTCITTNNWLQFVGNWTYWNASTWSNFNNYDTLAQANARNVSIWNNFGNYATVTNVSSANTSIWDNFQNYETVANASAMNASIWYALGNVSAPVDYTGLFFQNGTRVMTGPLNAGGFNISNVSSPAVSTDAATKGYTDTGISSAESIIGGWIQTNSSATLQTADSHIASNLSTVSTWIQSNNSATLATADSHIASNMSGVLHLTGGTMTGQINAGGYNLSNVSAPVSNGDVVNLNYFNTHSTGGSGTVSNTSISTASNVTVFSDATGRNISDSSIPSSSLITASTENSFKNILINPGFTVNQRVYVSGTNVSAGSPGNGYMHDRWRAGTGVTNTYTFGNTSPNAPQPITITNGTLIQTVENVNVAGGTYVSSWSGTSQARVGYGSSVAASLPSGAYSASPIVISNIPAGGYVTVEYNTGTLYEPQLESGTVPTKFEFRSYSTELTLCQRYYYRPGQSAYAYWGTAICQSTTQIYVMIQFPVKMRVAPTFTPSGTYTSFRVVFGGGAIVCSNAITAGPVSQETALLIANVASGLTANMGAYLSANNDATAYLGFSSEL